MELSVIIVNYNTKDKIEECLDSLTSELSDLASEIIVVDNASTDDSIEIIRHLAEKFKNTKLIENEENLGFAKANNQGATIATGNFLFFLNPDTKIFSGTIKKLLNFAKKHTDAVVVAPRLLNPDGSPQKSVRKLPTFLGAFKEYFLAQKKAYDAYVPEGKGSVNVEAVVGAAMLIPAKIFKEQKGFDERYFLYYEDLDFCRRARITGYKIYYIPEAKVVHSLGVSGREIKERTYELLLKSSKIYHGVVLSLLINQVIFWGQRWQKFFKKKN